jgi:hypothetical protein
MNTTYKSANATRMKLASNRHLPLRVLATGDILDLRRYS